MCCVWLSEKSVTFAFYINNRLVLINRSGERLQRGTD